MDRDSHSVPTSPDGLLLSTAGAIYLAGDCEGEVGGSLEIGIGLQSSGERHIPNAACLFPGKPANLRSSEKERMIWNARIDVDTAVVVSRVQIIRHVGRLRILPELRIVVSRTGIFHGTQRDATYAWHEQPGADQPIGFIGGFAGGPFLYPCAQNRRQGRVHKA